MNASDALRTFLAQLRDLLVRSEGTYWAETVSNAPQIAARPALAETVLAWFDDPAALTALVLTPALSHAVPSCAVDAANRAFVDLRRKLFRLARANALER